MGAMLWHHEVPWQPDVAAALRALQAAEFSHRYNFTSELEKWRGDAEEALRGERESGDQFGLVEIYTRQLETIAEIAAGPVPSSPQQQIAALRRVLPEGFGGVLDVTGVDANGGVHVIR